MSTVAAPHQGLGVAQYMWSSSPLRRYVDMVNQRQIIAMLRDEEPAYPKNDPALYTTMRDFDTMYGIYNEFQRSMERYWCLRWLQQEKIGQVNRHGGSPLPQIPSPQSTDGTTGETTSHPTKQPEDGCQVVGYSHLTDETTSHSTRLPEDGCQVVGYSHLTDETTSHSTRLPKDDNQVAGYNPAKDAGQVIDETTSHLTKAASCQVIGYGYSHSTRRANSFA